MPDEPKPIALPPIQGQPVINIPINVQLIYANGAGINISQSDIQISFSVNGRPNIATVMSLPVAKHLQTALSAAISNYERKTDSIIPDLNVIAEQLKKP